MSDTWGRSTFLSDAATNMAVDMYLDNVESLLMAIAQRPISDEQMERMARLLNKGERDCLSRAKPRQRRRIGE